MTSPLDLPPVRPYAIAPPVAPPVASSRGLAARTVALVATVGLLAGGIGGALGASAGDDDDLAPDTGRGAAVATSFGSGGGGFGGGGVADVAADVLPSVVSLSVRGPQGSGSGSGVVLDETGLILTNNHVVEAGVGGAIEVTFNDGRRAPAEIVGRDPVNDLAALDVDGLDDLQPIELGRSADVAVGAPVVAVGSPLGLSGTVTTGIVSALDRTVRTSGNAPLHHLLQTDASINPGNSGGALVDKQGRLIGINTAISTTGGGSIGLGFAIPVDTARAVAEQLVRAGQADGQQV